jgi:serine/threonine-protein phosphatase 2A regulatory subunit A
MSWLGDCVYSIRAAATKNLKNITQVFGVTWAKTAIFPKILTMSQNANYLYRITTLFALAVKN